jgi:Oxidoreductase molybdopterin binding domain
MKTIALALPWAALAASAAFAQAQAPTPHSDCGTTQVVVLGCPRAGPCPGPQTEGPETPVPEIIGPTGKHICVTPDVLKDLDRDQATMINHGASHTYEGVLLTELLRLVDAPTGARIHADADRDYLVVTGGDNFRAVYSLAETDRSVQRHPTILADHMDGAPLLPHDAPYRLVVDGDQKPSRSVYAVTKIEVKVLP